jgi:hypothetical protein
LKRRITCLPFCCQIVWLITWMLLYVIKNECCKQTSITVWLV